MSQQPQARIDRRQFLVGSAALGAGLQIGLCLADNRYGKPPAADAPFRPNAFLRIDRSGKVIFVNPYIEMGQGTYTAIPMLIAEELEVDVNTVVIEHSPPDDKTYVNPLIGIQMTGG